MAIRSLTDFDADHLPTVEELVVETGLDPYAAAVYLAVLSGDALTNDREYIPPDQVEAVRRAEEEAEAAFLAAMEQAAEVVDPSATVEENVARTGLDRRTIELYLSLRPRDASSDDRERGAEPPG